MQGGRGKMQLHIRIGQRNGVSELREEIYRGVRCQIMVCAIFCAVHIVDFFVPGIVHSLSNTARHRDFAAKPLVAGERSDAAGSF